MNEYGLWTFGYKKGPAAATTAQLEAPDERTAVLVAQEWCRQNGARFFGTVRPFVVAGPSILTSSAAPTEEVTELASPVTATTAVNDGKSMMDRAKSFVSGR